MSRRRITVFAVEGGGTRSRAVVFDTSNGLIASMRGGALNPSVVGLKGSLETLEMFTGWVLNTVSRVDTACLASAGVQSLPASDKNALKRVLERASKKTLVISDIDALLRLVRDGIVVVLGTGSVAAANRCGKMIRSGGWGYVVNDECGAYHLARKGLTTAFKALDGRGPHTVLVQELEKALGLSLTSAVKKLHEEYWQPTRLASLAPVVTRCAEMGDAVATKVVEDCLLKVVEMVLTVSRKTGYRKVYVCGGLLNSRVVQNLLSSLLKRKGLEFKAMRYSPLAGALYTALRKEGVGELEARRAVERLNISSL